MHAVMRNLRLVEMAELSLRVVFFVEGEGS